MILSSENDDIIDIASLAYPESHRLQGSSARDQDTFGRHDETGRQQYTATHFENDDEKVPNEETFKEGLKNSEP